LRIDFVVCGRERRCDKSAWVTFDLFEAEAHKGKGIENDFESFSVPANWYEHAEQSSLVGVMRDFRDLMQQMQAHPEFQGSPHGTYANW
jgi:hypothetical protein